MRIKHLQYTIFESVDPNTKDPYFENWQREIHPILMEIALAPDQIKQLFKSVEQSADAGGDNRSAIGQIKDEVKDLWFNKLGQALQSSQPVKDFDAKWEDIKAKVAAKHPDIAKKLAKYGEFAKNNPTTHKFLLGIAGSLAAALGLVAVGGVGAGIAATGFGVGGATAIINIADRLLQGQKASTAIGRGATAGIVAGLTAAGIKVISTSIESLLDNFRSGDQYAELIGGNPPVKVRINAEDAASLDKLGRASMKELKGIDIQDAMANGIKTPAGDAYSKSFYDAMVRASDPAYQQAIVDASAKAAASNVSVDALAAAANKLATAVTPASAVVGQAAAQESYFIQTRPLSEGQVYLLLKKIAATEQLDEGPMDWVKKGAAAVGKGIQRVGQNITNKITYEKLLAGWKLDGSPTDSEQLKKFLTSMEVSDEIVNKVYADMKISNSADNAAATQSTYAQVKDSVAKLDKKSRQRILKYIQGQLGIQS